MISKAMYLRFALLVMVLVALAIAVGTEPWGP